MQIFVKQAREHETLAVKSLTWHLNTTKPTQFFKKIINTLIYSLNLNRGKYNIEPSVFVFVVVFVVFTNHFSFVILSFVILDCCEFCQTKHGQDIGSSQQAFQHVGQARLSPSIACPSSTTDNGQIPVSN